MAKFLIRLSVRLKDTLLVIEVQVSLFSCRRTSGPCAHGLTFTV